MSRRASCLTRASLFATALLLTSIGAELYLRRFHPWLVRRELALYEARPGGRGWRHRADLSVTTSVDGRRVTMRTNSLGFRGREVAPTPAENTLRVAVLGDSFTFGLWASDDEQTFVARAEQHLADLRVELVNLGVGGYGFEEELLALREDALALQPELVLLCAYNGNDFRDSYLGTEARRVVRNILVDDAGVLRRRLPPESFVAPHRPLSARPWFDPSRLFLAQGLRRLFAQPRPVHASGRADESFPLETSFFGSSVWSLRDPGPLAASAIETSLDLVARIGVTCEEAGVSFALAAIPYRRQVSSQALEGSSFDLRLPQAHLQRLCAGRGWEFLDLLPSLREHRMRGGPALYVHGDTHLTDAGHHLVGVELASFLRPLCESLRAR